MNILVLDGNENQAVACVRLLARSRHIVRVGSAWRWSKAGLSRYCRGQFSYPLPQEDPGGFIDAIVGEVRRTPGSLVLPMTESTTLALSVRRADVAAAGGRLELAPHGTLLRAFDKLQTTELAKSLRIPVPHTVSIERDSEANKIAEALTYPVVLKPRSSQELSPRGALAVTGRPMYAVDAAQFRDAYARLRERCTRVIAQEFVNGRGAGYFALMNRNQLRVEFAHERIRDVHPTGSGSSVRVSTQPGESWREAGLAILHALDWHGVAMVEFRIRPDGTPVFIEVNGRFWNSLPLACYAGVDFPAYLAEMAEYGDMTSPKPAHRPGVRCRWILGDFRHAVEVFKGKPPGFPGHFPGRVETLFSVLTPVPGTYHDNFQLGDPLPELGDWLDFFLRRIPGALARRRHS